MSITPLKRRGAALTAVLLSATLALTACGSEGDDTGDDTAAEASATDSITADNGTFEIPAEPQRVVTIGNTSQPFVDMGGEPVGANPYYDLEALPDDQQAVFAAAAEIGEEPDLEQVAGLEPDLILVQMDDPTFEKIEPELQAIAPTLFWSLDTEWKELAASIAEAGNVGDTLDQQTEEFEERKTRLQDTYGDLLADTSFVDVSRGDWSDPGTFYIADIGCSEIGRDDVGLDLPEAAEGEDPLAYASLPFEQLSSLAEYDVITYPIDDEGQPFEPFVPVLETNTWKALPAVESGHAVGVFCPGNGSYGQVNRYLESLESALANLPAQE
jgi:iron complex transport system substrate-binding protein